MPLDDALARFRAASRQQFDGMLDERVNELAGLMEREASAAGRATTQSLNLAARRLRQTGTIEEWKAAVADSAAGFCAGASVFDAGDDEVAQAPAMATVIETKDTVVALRSPSELPAAVFERYGPADPSRCYLFPILYRNRVAAILYTQPGGDGLDTNALELICALAGATIPRPASPKLVMPAAPAVVEKPAPAAATSIWKDWSALSAGEQEAHLRAQRFARVRVAEMRLYDADAVERGRTGRDLYICLRGKIDLAREDFRKEFVEKCPSMTDYLHREMVRTLANDDEAAMGQEYPGALT